MATYWPTDSTWYWPTTTSSSTFIYTNDYIWSSWNTTTASVTNSTWEWWVQHNSSEGTRIIPTPALTPEQAAAQEAERVEQQARWAEQQRVHDLAQATARSLLEAMLTEAQLRDHQQRGFFEVLAESGRRYRINTKGSAAGNVKLMVGESGEQIAASVCAHLFGREPWADSWIAQKLALEDDEEGFWAVANPSWRQRIEVPQPMRTRALRERPVQLVA